MNVNIVLDGQHDVPERALYLESEDTGSIWLYTSGGSQECGFLRTDKHSHARDALTSKNGYHHPPATLSPIVGLNNGPKRCPYSNPRKL